MFGYNTNNQCFIILLRSGLFVGCFAGFISLLFVFNFTIYNSLMSFSCIREKVFVMQEYNLF